tara:strand:- start:6 stop:548 length:543 start_codon:yes stop_codon:yes gene_type:complete
MSETNFLLEALQEFEQRVVQAAKDNLKKQKKDSTGKLSNSIKGEVKVMPNSIRMFFQMEEYGFYQDRGVNGIRTVRSDREFSFKKGVPSREMLKSLDVWIRRKGIKAFTPRNKKGQFTSRKSLKFMLARSIFNKGIKASMFFTKPFNSAFEKLPNELIEKYGLDMENLLVSIIEENLKTK